MNEKYSIKNLDKFSRREILKYGLMLGASVLIPSCTSMNFKRDESLCKGDDLCEKIRDEKFYSLYIPNANIFVLEDENRFCTIVPNLSEHEYNYLLNKEGQVKRIGIEEIIGIMSNDPYFKRPEIKEVSASDEKISGSYIVLPVYDAEIVSGKKTPEYYFSFSKDGKVLLNIQEK